MGVKEEYNQTKVSIIPKDWNISVLKELTTSIVSGRSKSATQNGTYPVYGSTGIIGFTEQPDYQGKAILVARVGANAGKINKVSGKYGVTDNTIIIKVKAENSFSFISQLLEIKKLNDLVFGSGQPLITGSQLKSLQFITPKLNEQEHIASVLIDTDKLLKSLSRQIIKKKNIMLATMQQVLNKKIRVRGFTKDWKKKKLGEILVYEQPTKYLVSNTNYNDMFDTPVLTAGKTFYLGYTNEKNGIYKNLPAIIFDDFTTVSKYVNFEFKVKSSAMKLLTLRNKSSNLEFIYQLMQMIQFKVGEHKRHWISEYSKIEVNIPDKEEQDAIAVMLSSMQKEINKLIENRDKTNKLKLSIMQELLTGKTRLTKLDSANV